MALSISQQQSNIINKVQALKTYNDVSKTEKSILDKAGSSFSNVSNSVSSQLDKLKDQQKRFQRNPPTSIERLLDLLQATRGSGPETIKYLRRIIIQTLMNIGPDISKILTEEALKAAGCSQEQTYTGINVKNLQISSLNLLPVNQGTYIPVKNIDLSGTLKIPVEGWLGQLYYEKEIPSTSEKFIPYGGKIRFPVNRMLRGRTIDKGETYEKYFGQYYNGKSGQNLFDITYTTTNDLGVSGDYFRVFLLDREDAPVTSSGVSLNSVGQFITDYYSTIQLYSIPQVIATIVNQLTGAVSIKARFGFGQLEEQSKFNLLLMRILGLCFDEREEIDVSGVSKIGELDGVDDSFFEFNEVDLRNIELDIANVQEGVAVFEDCNNVRLPVNADEITSQLVDFANQISGQTNDQTVSNIENILDSLSKNKQWELLLPSNASLSIAIDRNFIKNLPIALASSLLNPKVLLPFYTVIYELEKMGKKEVNKVISSQNEIIQSANSVLQSGTTFGQTIASNVNDSVDFVKKNKSFVIQLVSRIATIFIETLFNTLKKDIFNLLTVILKDISKSQITKQTVIISKLVYVVQATYLILRSLRDYRKCKSLLDEISMLLELINNFKFSGFKIPAFLNIFATLLPGFSAERATLNLIENLEKLGLPTGAMPDGSSNLMNLFSKSMISGIDREEAENGKVETSLKLPPPFGLLSTAGKKY
jgi:hypothetical protein